MIRYYDISMTKTVVILTHCCLKNMFLEQSVAVDNNEWICAIILQCCNVLLVLQP